VTGHKATNADEQVLNLAASVLRDLANSGSSKLIHQLSDALDRRLSAPVAAHAANVLAHHHFQAHDYESALSACNRWLEAAPNEPAAVTSLLSILVRLRRFDEVAEMASDRLKADADNFELHSSLTHALGRLGRTGEARDHGNRCLELKDGFATAPPLDLKKVPVPPFDPAARARNIIAFSLYGTARAYLEGALRNAVAAQFLYPEWTCRFYIDASVPGAVVKELVAHGAEVKRVDGLPAARFGTFWRFLIADDPKVDRYLIRDSDACLNLRERVAVEDWIESGRHFHVMRDAITHTELILAGMWGGVRGALPPMGEAMIGFSKDAPLSRTADQQFLRERVWPTVRRSVLAHDSNFAFGGSCDFPARGRLPPGQRVGQAVARAVPAPR
jgi:tetratricopeptide (TPR) repeat protein